MPAPFKSAEAAAQWYLAEGFALIQLACIQCGDVWIFPYCPGETVPRGCICPECQEQAGNQGKE